MDIKTSSAYEKNKPAIYKWRDLNKEKYNYNDISDKAQAIYIYIFILILVILILIIVIASSPILQTSEFRTFT